MKKQRRKIIAFMGTIVETIVLAIAYLILMTNIKFEGTIGAIMQFGYLTGFIISWASCAILLNQWAK